MNYSSNLSVHKQIAYRAFASQNLLKINANIEMVDNRFAKDSIYVSFCKGFKQGESKALSYDTKNAKSILINAIDLRSLAFAMKEILKTKVDMGYFKITSSGGDTNKITLGYSSSLGSNGFTIDTFYINYTLINQNNTLGVSFNKWDFASFSETLMGVANLCEEELFKNQKALRN